MEGIEIFNKLVSHVQDSLPMPVLQMYSEYIYTTFMRQHKLFHCVFTTQREALLIKMDMPVELPPDAGEFKESKRIDIYDYEQQLNEIIRREEETLLQRQKLHEERSEIEQDELQQAKEQVNTTQTPVDREVSN